MSRGGSLGFAISQASIPSINRRDACARATAFTHFVRRCSEATTRHLHIDTKSMSGREYCPHGRRARLQPVVVVNHLVGSRIAVRFASSRMVMSIDSSRPLRRPVQRVRVDRVEDSTGNRGTDRWSQRTIPRLVVSVLVPVVPVVPPSLLLVSHSRASRPAIRVSPTGHRGLNAESCATDISHRRALC